MRWGGMLLAGGMVLGQALGQAAGVGAGAASTVPHRTRLILKDGTYQTVMSYKVVGERVRFVSAERGGDTEEIPAALVDLVATRRWESQHTAGAEGQAPPVVLDPELLKEEADRASLSPEVWSGPEGSLRLPVEDSVLALDVFHGAQELVPLAQQQSDLNKQTGHNILKATINPLASSHQIVELKGERADVQMHVERPEIYLRVGDDADLPTGGTPLKVDTHGATGAAKQKQADPQGSQYVIVRVDVRKGARVVASFNTNVLGTTKQQEDVIETDTTVLPGGHWMKIVPKQGLLFGEYCLMELISPKEINLGVWDFGVHPTAPENRDVIKPERKRAVGLGRRR